MRKYLLVFAMALFAATAFAAEKGDMAAGVNVSYGTSDGYSNFGLGAEFQYNITDAIRIEPSANYFLKKDYITMWDINVNAHYVFNVMEQLEVYPLAGVTLLGVKASYDGFEYGGYEIEGGSTSESKFGVNLGGGAQYWMTENIALSFEIKYQLVSDFDRPVFQIGAAYKF